MPVFSAILQRLPSYLLFSFLPAPSALPLFCHFSKPSSSPVSLLAATEAATRCVHRPITVHMGKSGSADGVQSHHHGKRITNILAPLPYQMSLYELETSVCFCSSKGDNGQLIIISIFYIPLKVTGCFVVLFFFGNPEHPKTMIQNN